jgi:spore germination cell wall hydrolase CwlJ-like protein
VTVPAATAPATATLLLLEGGGILVRSTQAAVIGLGVAVSDTGDWDEDEAATSEPVDPATCLTQAVYYEARSESLAGQQAVAQVVLNRTRVSRYPSSVCGVVFQRARETSGCQFSFVCDGSMYRPMDWTAWQRARAVAAHALGGFVYKPMLNATHYHAAWMTPYWASHFERIRQIGGQIFYR